MAPDLSPIRQVDGEQVPPGPQAEHPALGNEWRGDGAVVGTAVPHVGLSDGIAPQFLPGFGVEGRQNVLLAGGEHGHQARPGHGNGRVTGTQVPLPSQTQGQVLGGQSPGCTAAAVMVGTAEAGPVSLGRQRQQGDGDEDH